MSRDMDSHLDWPFFTAEHRELAQQARAWVADQCAGSARPEANASPEETERQCQHWVQTLGQAGWLQHAVGNAAAIGQDRLDLRTICLLRETLAYHSGLADFCFAMQGLGAGAILLHGNAAQKSAYLPRIASGAAIAAFALSEEEAGSDAAALSLQACRAGEDWLLSGEKTWVSNGGIADVYVVFAHSGEAPGAAGISAFIVDADVPGLEVAERLETLTPHPLARLRFDRCRVTADKLIGQPGEGFRIAMRTLDVFRSSVAAAALGFARRACDTALQHAQSRTMFGRQLADMQLTQARLADMATAIDAAALLTYRAAWQHDQAPGQPVTRAAAMAKLFATEQAQQVIDSAVQLLGGRGVLKQGICATLYQEIRALRIYEGASEVQQLIIAREMLRQSRTHLP